jgi:UDP-GlcNAc:undecaprenyl-phosphate GlcNAc-1-phosphate transferase
MANSILLIGAALVSLLLSFPLQKFARSTGLVDRPTDRKSHEGDTPLIGGIIIFLTILAFAIHQQPTYLLPYFLALALGLADDRFQLRPFLRVLGQVVIAGIIASQIQISSLGNLFGSEIILSGYTSYIFTTFAIVGLMNAFNLIDGLDGLCVTIFLVGYVGFWASMNFFPTGFFIMAGACIGFLLQNFRFYLKKRARIFLGDGGAYLLGAIFAASLIGYSQGYFNEGNIYHNSPVLVLFTIMVPLCETLGVLIKRTFFDKKSFSVAGKDHMHYYIAETLGSKNKAVFLINMIAFFWIVFSVTLHSLGASNTVLLLIYLVMLFMHTNTLILFSKYKKKKKLASP